MKWLTLIGFVFAVPFGLLAIAQILDLTDTAAGLTTGGLQQFIQQLFPITTYVLGGVVAVGLVILAALAFNRV